MAIAVRAADFTELATWLEIVREVEPLFGDMPDFTEHAQRAVERGTAVVAVERGRVLGGVLPSRDDRPHQIHWLAVRGTAGDPVSVMP